MFLGHENIFNDFCNTKVKSIQRTIPPPSNDPQSFEKHLFHKETNTGCLTSSLGGDDQLGSDGKYSALTTRWRKSAVITRDQPYVKFHFINRQFKSI